MRAAFATLAVAGLAAANPMPQAVTSAIAPAGSAPAGCYPNYDGTFLIAPVNVSSSSKRGLEEVEFEIIETRNTKLGISLKGGILTDPQGRTGYIASNQQFQFDGPPQAGAIWTAGFSVCNNKRLALGSDDTWYKCLSGGFFNLYFKSIGGQCIESYLLTRVDTGTGELSGGPPASGVVTSTANSASASGASSGASGSSGASSPTAGGNNGTATASGSMSGSANMTATESASSSGMTGVGGGRTTTTGGGGQMTTTTGGGGSPTAGGAAQSSSSQQAAPLATLRSEMFGLAAGVLALVAL